MLLGLDDCKISHLKETITEHNMNVDQNNMSIAEN